jgi:hypothetical protein
VGLVAFVDHLGKADKDEWMDDWAELAFSTLATSISRLITQGNADAPLTR